jgi:hypothetical protein
MSQTARIVRILCTIGVACLSLAVVSTPMTTIMAQQAAPPERAPEPGLAEQSPPAALQSMPLASEAAAVSAAARAVSVWSGFTSEEYPPLTAANGQLISAMRCRGSYCDDVYLGYEIVPGVNHASNYWTPYFSEEAPNSQICSGPNNFMTGISCKGSYCDNVSLQCTSVSGKTKTTCKWMPWFSEEAEYSYLEPGYYASGLACRGRYCDDKSILACK